MKNPIYGNFINGIYKMRFKVDDSKKFLIVVDSTQIEYEQLESSFTKRTMNWGAIRNKDGCQMELMIQ